MRWQLSQWLDRHHFEELGFEGSAGRERTVCAALDGSDASMVCWGQG
jgi:hypothetical protein